jgi:hypothetical protein
VVLEKKHQNKKHIVLGACMHAHGPDFTRNMSSSGWASSMVESLHDDIIGVIYSPHIGIYIYIYIYIFSYVFVKVLSSEVFISSVRPAAGINFTAQAQYLVRVEALSCR